MDILYYSFSTFSYYKVAVFIVALQELYAILLEILSLFNLSYHLMVFERLQPQSLCIFVNQLDTA
nr:MAG TPA: hypothetical protein [Caudoviricetes sp.]